MRKIIPFLTIPAAVILGASYYTYQKAFYHPPRRREKPFVAPEKRNDGPYREQIDGYLEAVTSLPFEEVRIHSYDGTELVGHYYHQADGAPLQIQFHGYKGTPVRDFCGGHTLARSLGHNILLVEQRAHGSNRRRSISFGVKERRDCLAWAEYAAQRFGEDQKILLVGVSMGATTVLMASELALPRGVVGVIADCPYSTPREIICKVAGEMGFPPRAAYPFLWTGALLYGGFRLDSDGAVGAVKRSRLPVLLIHGEADDFVPCEMSRAIKAAGGERIRLETFPGATHGMSLLADPERYRRVTEEFCESVLH